MTYAEDIRRILEEAAQLRSSNGVRIQSQLATSGPYYPPELYLPEERGPRQPGTERGCPTWGSSATAHSAAFDALAGSSASSEVTSSRSVRGYGPEAAHRQRPAIPDYVARPLPCEFKEFSGCRASFNDVDAWIDHMTNEHLRACFPVTSICWFCDDIEFRSTPERSQDKESLYRQRMVHIANHFSEGETADSIRPDFFFLDHLHQNALIEESAFQWATQQGELPGRYEPHDFYGHMPSAFDMRQQYVETSQDSSARRRRGRNYGH